jgi:hypothetical protein
MRKWGLLVVVALSAPVWYVLSLGPVFWLKERYPGVRVLHAWPEPWLRWSDNHGKIVEWTEWYAGLFVPRWRIQAPGVRPANCGPLEDPVTCKPNASGMGMVVLSDGTRMPLLEHVKASLRLWEEQERARTNAPASQVEGQPPE